MLKNQMLYCKGMDMSDSEECLSGDDKWDDSQLTAAYDKAVEMANIDVAKRIAMSTNGQREKEPAQAKPKSKRVTKKKPWKAGMPCRAVYEADGLEYEAFVLRVVNENECIVRFLGYDNSELVTIDTMKPSQGKEAQQIQIEQAALEKGEESDASIPRGDDEEVQTDETMSPRPERSYHKRAKEIKRGKGIRKMNSFQLPEVPIPDISKLRQIHSLEMPIAPPPISFTASINSEDQAVSNMLLSWYMSGYYTGLYQGMRMPSSSSQSKPKE